MINTPRTAGAVVRGMTLVTIAIVVAGCGSKKQRPANTAANPPANNQKDKQKTPPPQQATTIRFTHADGKSAFSLIMRKDGATLVDGKKQEVAHFEYTERSVRIKDPQHNVLGQIVGNAKQLNVTDPTRSVTFFKLQPGQNEDWQLEDRQNRLVLHIQKEGSGLALQSPSGKRLASVALEDGVTSLRNADEMTVYKTSDFPQLAIACLGMETLKDIRLRFGLAVACCCGL